MSGLLKLAVSRLGVDQDGISRLGIGRSWFSELHDIKVRSQRKGLSARFSPFRNWESDFNNRLEKSKGLLCLYIVLRNRSAC